MPTRVWINKKNGHHFADDGVQTTLNGKPFGVIPDWVDAASGPDAVYGDMIEWGGGECPVDPNQEVRCIFRGRLPYLGPAIWPDFNASAAAVMWQHAPSGPRIDPQMDIIAYQVRID